MDFEDTPEEAAFRAQVRSWIDANAPKHLEDQLKRANFGDMGVTSEDPIQACKSWQKKKAEAGWACLHWPKEYGGGNRTPMERVIWNQEEGIFRSLGGLFTIGQGMCGPTVMAWADEETKRRMLPPLASGEEVWCQLFSEPASGSDLAGLRTRAVKAEDGSGDWIVNGQKIWTSQAHNAQWGICLARTNPEAPKHKGITYFLFDMLSDGIDVRPLREITLLAVYQALGRPHLFAIGNRSRPSGCLVERNVNAAMADTLATAEALLIERFGRVTLDQLSTGSEEAVDTSHPPAP